MWTTPYTVIVFSTLTTMSPRHSVKNSGNAVIALWASSLMWIFRAETLTDTRHCAVHASAKLFAYLFINVAVKLINQHAEELGLLEMFEYLL